MTSNKPYLLRALNEWILDNGQTPHVIVDVNAGGIEVPPQAVRDGKLVLNISPQATRNLLISNDAVSFQARFSGKSHEIFLPMDAVLAIYARENGQGMMFAHGVGMPEDRDAGKEEPGDKPQDGPHLKLIK